MDKSSRLDIPLEEQRQAWNRWNATVRAKALGKITEQHARLVDEAIAALGRSDLKLIEVGCGTGWLCERLRKYGKVTGVDLSDEVLQQARLKSPEIEYLAGDFMTLDLPAAAFDVAFTLDTLSHFADQAGFISRVARVLRPGGLLVVVTQNRAVLERWSAIPGPQPGQIRQWVDHRKLRELLDREFRDVNIGSTFPVGDQGLLRIINSYKLNKVVNALVGGERVQRMKERAMLGHSLVAHATKRG
jgi:SAM-dependent methyltransferase